MNARKLFLNCSQCFFFSSKWMSKDQRKLVQKFNCKKSKSSEQFNLLLPHWRFSNYKSHLLKLTVSLILSHSVNEVVHTPKSSLTYGSHCTTLWFEILVGFWLRTYIWQLLLESARGPSWTVMKFVALLIALITVLYWGFIGKASGESPEVVSEEVVSKWNFN